MIFKDVSLKKYNTFGLDCRADSFITVKSESEAVQLLRDKKIFKRPVLILGGGSNLLFTGDYKGTILHPEIPGIKIEEEKADHLIVSSGAGVKWDNFVEWSVKKGLGGVENLSFIPGSVGASPVQNIGAYGVEVRETIERVRAIDMSDGSIKEFSNEECRFGYRESILKRELKGKYLVTYVFFRLTTNPSLNTSYGSLKEEAEKSGPVSLRTLREAIVRIRMSKLPDPLLIGNAGSFFKNPLIRETQADGFRQKNPDAPVYCDDSGRIKVAAGWLIDKCGWKGKRIGDAGVHDKQALVLVNHGKATGSEILKLSELIQQSVFDRFSIELEREVEVI